MVWSLFCTPLEYFGYIEIGLADLAFHPISPFDICVN
jgi:hypothetical protein